MKPEIWQDEAMEDVSRDARLLFVGLITQADDEGRLRGSPALLRAQIFPYDTDLTSEEIGRWLDELTSADLVQRYESEGKAYLQLRGWHNQKIDRPSPSRLPDPPPGGSASPRQPLAEDSTNARSGSEGIKEGSKDQGEEGPSGIASIPTPLLSVVDELSRVVEGKKRARELKLSAALKACRDFADRDLQVEADKFAHYWLDGAGENREIKDVAGAWRNWLRRAPRASTVAKRGPQAASNVSADVQHIRQMAAELREQEAAEEAAA